MHFLLTLRLYPTFTATKILEDFSVSTYCYAIVYEEWTAALKTTLTLFHSIAKSILDFKGVKLIPYEAKFYLNCGFNQTGLIIIAYLTFLYSSPDQMQEALKKIHGYTQPWHLV